MAKVYIVFGTRPEVIKLFPVYHELLKRGISVKLINTGQHKDLLSPILSMLKLDPEVDLQIMQKNQTLSDLTAKLMKKLGKLFANEKPEYIIVQGDTTSAFTAALTGFYNQIKVIHIEAGLRTYNKNSPFPEELNRQMISALADYHFAPTSQAYDNLITENKANVYMSGNTVIDALQHIKGSVGNYQHNDPLLEKCNGKKIILVTLHRRENFGEKLKNICEAIKFISETHKDINFIFPVHPNPNVRHEIFHHLKNTENIFLEDPLPYDHLLQLLSRSFIVLTDSGGIQEEAPSFNVPVIVLRDTTERPEGIEAGCAVLAGTEKNVIIQLFEKLLNNATMYMNMSNAPNPYGDGKAAQRIVDVLYPS